MRGGEKTEGPEKGKKRRRIKQTGETIGGFLVGV